jgi:nucleoid-associated protein YgaU
MTSMIPPVRGFLRRQDHGGFPLLFHYNPTTVSVTKMANWNCSSQRNARRAPQQEYTGGRPATLSMKLLFDNTDVWGSSVTRAVGTLMDWSVPTSESIDNNRPQPPVLVLQWGAESYFPCRIKRLRIRYTLFNAAGTPVRATCDVSMVEVPDEPGPQNPTSGGISGRKSVVLDAGDSLPAVAYREYGNPNLWRALAEANGVDDPLRVRPGMSLLVPSRSDATRLSRRDPDA